MIVVNYRYYQDGKYSHFYEPLMLFTDVFMQTVYSGENNLSNILISKLSSYSDLDALRLQIILPYNTGLFLSAEKVKSELCNDAT